MVDKEKASRNALSADWFLRGALTRIGDTFDRLTGRRWVPSSSLATSELIERMKRLLDSEVREVPGKGQVVPHNIKLKMQWDKFSTDSGEALVKLEHELLVAAADHINDSSYYTYAPLSVEVKPDYFTEGVRLYVGFDKFSDENPEVGMNVTITGVQFDDAAKLPETGPVADDPAYIARYAFKGYPREKRLEFPAGRRISVGRTANNYLVLDDESVSKIHAALVVDDDGNLSVADTGSTNGTFVNGERIAYGKASRLAEGDQVKFGVVDVTFERLQAAGDDRVARLNRDENAVSIDGFDFTTRISTEPEEVAANSSIPGNAVTTAETPDKDISDDITEANYPDVVIENVSENKAKSE